MGDKEKTQKSKKATLGIGFNATDALSSYAKHNQSDDFNKTAVAVFRLYLGLDDPDKKPDGIDAATWDRIAEEFKTLDSIKNRNRSNGNHGGRPPRKNPDGTQRKPRRNPKETQTEPKGNPDGTQTEPNLAREEREGELEIEDSPPTPPEGGMVVVDGEDADWKKVVPSRTEIEEADKFWMFYPQRKGSKEQFRQSWSWACRYRGLTLVQALDALDDQETRGEFDDEHISDAPWPAVWVRDGHWLNAAVPGGKKNTAPPAQGPLVADPEERFASIKEALSAGKGDAEGYLGDSVERVNAELEARRKAGVRI